MTSCPRELRWSISSNITVLQCSGHGVRYGKRSVPRTGRCHGNIRERRLLFPFWDEQLLQFRLGCCVLVLDIVSIFGGIPPGLFSYARGQLLEDGAIDGARFHDAVAVDLDDGCGRELVLCRTGRGWNQDIGGMS